MRTDMTGARLPIMAWPTSRNVSGGSVSIERLSASHVPHSGATTRTSRKLLTNCATLTTASEAPRSGRALTVPGAPGRANGRGGTGGRSDLVAFMRSSWRTARPPLLGGSHYRVAGRSRDRRGSVAEGRSAGQQVGAARLDLDLTLGTGPRLFAESAAAGKPSLTVCEPNGNGVANLAYRRL